MSEDTNIPQMRETIERLSKENAGLKKDNSDLQGQLRVRDARDTMRQAGYNPKHGDLYAAMNPEGEITAEAVSTFAEEQGLPTFTADSAASDDAGDSTNDGGADTTQLAAMSGSGSRGGDGGAGGADVQTMTRAEWKQLYADDPVAARQAVASGRVEISRGNPIVGGSGSPRGENPYVTVGSDA